MKIYKVILFILKQTMCWISPTRFKIESVLLDNRWKFLSRTLRFKTIKMKCCANLNDSLYLCIAHRHTHTQTENWVRRLKDLKFVERYTDFGERVFAWTTTTNIRNGRPNRRSRKQQKQQNRTIDYIGNLSGVLEIRKVSKHMRELDNFYLSNYFVD